MTRAGANRVYLHLGSPKTGTTYLQEILWNNRKTLAEAGVLYPGDRPEAHFQAAMDLQGAQFQEDWFDENVPQAWDRLVRQAREWPGDVVISHELFCTADVGDVERALADLSFAEVHLVCTARDLLRQLPAVWQEDVKNRHTVSYAEFVEGVRGESAQPHFLSALFWQRQDLPTILDRWARGVPPERVHVVTVPPAGRSPELVWQRFAGLVGVDPGLYDTSVRQPNKSLGVAETELVRRLNETLDGRLDWPSYDSVVKYQVSALTLGSRKARTPISVPPEDRDWLRQQARQLVAALSDAGYDVVGDLDELVPDDTDPGQRTHPDHADDRELADVAVETLAATLQRLAEHESAAASVPPPPAPVGLRPSLVHLCEQHPALSRVPWLYRRAKAAGTRLKQRG